MPSSSRFRLLCLVSFASALWSCNCGGSPNDCTPVSAELDTSIWANTEFSLNRVDPSTFAATPVGNFNLGDSVTDIAMTPEGVLYGVSFTRLYRIDKTTGQATLVTALTGTGNNGLTFLSDGTLLASDASGAIKRIDPTSGAVTALGTFGNGLTSSGDLVAVQGVMYGISSTSAGGADASSDNVLLRVDTSTGAATVVGPIGFGNVWGLAYANGRVVAFTNTGQVIEVNPETGAGTLLSSGVVSFWGAAMSPLTPTNPCR